MYSTEGLCSILVLWPLLFWGSWFITPEFIGELFCVWVPWFWVVLFELPVFVCLAPWVVVWFRRWSLFLPFWWLLLAWELLCELEESSLILVSLSSVSLLGTSTLNSKLEFPSVCVFTKERYNTIPKTHIETMPII